MVQPTTSLIQLSLTALISRQLLSVETMWGEEGGEKATAHFLQHQTDTSQWAFMQILCPSLFTFSLVWSVSDPVYNMQLNHSQFIKTEGFVSWLVVVVPAVWRRSDWQLFRLERLWLKRLSILSIKYATSFLLVPRLKRPPALTSDD